MDDTFTPSILAVGTPLPALTRSRAVDDIVRAAQIAEVDSATGAAQVLRVMRFDLLAVGGQVIDGGPWRFVSRVRAAWPDQKWAWLSDEADPQDEIMARTLGAVASLDGPDAWRHAVEIASQIHRRGGMKVQPDVVLNLEAPSTASRT
jgi:hypothetical protein